MHSTSTILVRQHIFPGEKSCHGPHQIEIDHRYLSKQNHSSHENSRVMSVSEVNITTGVSTQEVSSNADSVNPAYKGIYVTISGENCDVLGSKINETVIV